MNENSFDSIEQRIKNNTYTKDDVLDLFEAIKFYHTQLPIIYCHITGNRLSYPNYTAEAVISAYEDNMEWQKEVWEQEWLENLEDKRYP